MVCAINSLICVKKNEHFHYADRELGCMVRNKELRKEEMGMRWDLQMPGLPRKKTNNSTTPTKGLEIKKILEGTEIDLCN